MRQFAPSPFLLYSPVFGKPQKMKAIFKSAATMASSREGPFRDFYQGLLSQGMKPAIEVKKKT